MEMEPLLSSQVVSARDQDGSRDLGWKQGGLKVQVVGGNSDSGILFV